MKPELDGLSRVDAHLTAVLTQAQLVTRIGVRQQAYAKLESPDANFTMETLARAAQALGLRVEVDLMRSDTGEMAPVR